MSDREERERQELQEAALRWIRREAKCFEKSGRWDGGVWYRVASSEASKMAHERARQELEAGRLPVVRLPRRGRRRWQRRLFNWAWRRRLSPPYPATHHRDQLASIFARIAYYNGRTDV